MDAILTQILLPLFLTITVYIIMLFVIIFSKSISNKAVIKAGTYSGCAAAAFAFLYAMFHFKAYSSFWYWLLLLPSFIPFVWVNSIVELFLRTRRCERCHRWFKIKYGISGKVRKTEIRAHVDSEGYHYDGTNVTEMYWEGYNCTCKACGYRYGWYSKGKGTKPDIVELAPGEYMKAPEEALKQMKENSKYPASR